MHMHSPEPAVGQIDGQPNTEISTVTWDIEQLTRVSVTSTSPTVSKQVVIDQWKPELLRVLFEQSQSYKSQKEAPQRPLLPPISSQDGADLCAVCQRPFCHLRSHKQVTTDLCVVCHRSSCQLKSHRQYVNYLKQRQSKKQESMLHQEKALSIGPSYAKSYSLPRPLGNSTFDHFIALPIDKASEPKLNRLFRDCKDPFNISLRAC